MTRSRMYLARNGVMVGHYADHDFTAHARHSWTPRSGFVQPLLWAVIDTDTSRPARVGWSTGETLTMGPDRSFFCGMRPEFSGASVNHIRAKVEEETVPRAVRGGGKFMPPPKLIN